MSQGILEAVGGLGLFLLGMFVMTDGLKRVAGRAIRSSLRRFTRSPITGAATGAITTAIVQSSSATTVAAVGFVGARLMTFAEALGIIFGANIGTTITGWIVALFGFKLPLGTFAYPIVLVGALLRLLGKGRMSAVGEALAGFGVIFIGMSLMQHGLGGLQGMVTPDTFPPNTLFGRVQLVGIGIGITLVTQSSSAGIAMALAAVHTGTISFPQAAAIVIGMDIGTTVTAVIATIGGGTQVKRTGTAHVIYNGLTGIFAFFLLVPYVAVVELISDDVLITQPELLLVGFHSLFNFLGVVAVLPFTRVFARFIEGIIKEPEDRLTHRLGPSLLTEPEAALDTVEQTLRDITERSLSLFLRMWRSMESEVTEQIATLRAAVVETRDYTTRIQGERQTAAIRFRHTAALHATDHLDRLLDRLARRERLETVLKDDELRSLGATLETVAVASTEWLREEAPSAEVDAKSVTDKLVSEIHPYRTRVIEAAVDRKLDAAAIDLKLDAARWLARMAGHMWRIDHHLVEMAGPHEEVTPLAPSAEHDVGEPP